MIKITLAPPSERKGISFSLPTFNLGMLFGILSLASIVLVVGYSWRLSSQREQLEREISILTRQLETLKAAVTEGNRYKAERDDLEKRVVAVEELTRNQTRPIYFLDALADAIPRDLWINGTSERDRIFHFNGTAYSSTAVADFMSNLKSSGKFKDVDLVLARQDINKVPRTITFEIVCRFEI